jgi:DNA replication and repair protein RecF
MVSPSDTSLINGSGDERRRFINAILSQVDKEYLRRVMRYNQLIAQRNKLLKMEHISYELLETISERMAPDALYIYNKRLDLCKRLQVLIKEYYSKLSGAKEEISLKYMSDLEEFIISFPTDLQDSNQEAVASNEEALLKLFDKTKGRDAVLHYTSAGVQRDDVEFLLGSHPIKRCGSQGQQKSFLIALKLAQFTLMKELHGCTPILLLDDVFDKLDMQRVEYLLGLVASEDFGQIFITDSNKVRMAKIASSITDNVASFEVVCGDYRCCGLPEDPLL